MASVISRSGSDPVASSKGLGRDGLGGHGTRRRSLKDLEARGVTTLW
jgi:hypothetical protein